MVTQDVGGKILCFHEDKYGGYLRKKKEKVKKFMLGKVLEKLIKAKI